MAELRINHVGSLLSAIKSDSLHGQAEFPHSTDWDAFLWLRNYAKQRGATDIDEETLIHLIKKTTRSHRLSYASILVMPLADFCKRLAELARIAKPANETSPGSPTGFLGGVALADALGIHASRRDAFFRQLGRQRMSLGDDRWHEVRDPRPNSPRFLYCADSPKLRELATAYNT